VPRAREVLVNALQLYVREIPTLDCLFNARIERLDLRHDPLCFRLLPRNGSGVCRGHTCSCKTERECAKQNRDVTDSLSDD
jgi:hypothetical protein